MMMRATMAAVVLALLALPAVAGEIYGTVSVTSPAGPVDDAVVKAKCGKDAEPIDGNVNANGGYSVRFSGSHPRCAVSVRYDGQDTNWVIVSIGSGSTRANLRLSRQAGGWRLVSM